MENVCTEVRFEMKNELNYLAVEYMLKYFNDIANAQELVIEEKDDKNYILKCAQVSMGPKEITDIINNYESIMEKMSDACDTDKLGLRVICAAISEAEFEMHVHIENGDAGEWLDFVFTRADRDLSVASSGWYEPDEEDLMDIGEIIADLESYYESAGFTDVYETMLKDATEAELRGMHRRAYEEE